MMKTLKLIVPITASLIVSHCLFAQGPLTPPGPPAPTMKTLQQVEPRVPITNMPVTLTAPGSYYVTTNLTGNPGGITIAASGVTVDLMGFELVGGTGAGVAVSGSRTNIIVRNGILRNWTGYGVDCGSAANGQITGITASGNGSGGAFAGGISTGPSFLVRECTVFTNVFNGIRVGNGCIVEHCVVRANGADGIGSDSSDVTIRDNGVTGNGGNGIRTNNRARITGNTCIANGLTSGTGAGIETGSDQNWIENNMAVGNSAGIRVLGGGNVIVRNMARNNSPLGDYLITTSNRMGPTNNVYDANGTITNLNPWLNLPQ